MLNRRAYFRVLSAKGRNFSIPMLADQRAAQEELSQIQNAVH